MSLGDVLKAAGTDALKKCATLFGVALHLYMDEPPRAPAAPSPAPPANGHPPTTWPRPSKPREPSADEDARARLVAAIESTLFVRDGAGQLHWRPGLKAAAERYFGSFRWADIKQLELERLERDYAALIVALAPSGSDEPEPADDVADFEPTEDRQKSSAVDLKGGKVPSAEGPRAPFVSSSAPEAAPAQVEPSTLTNEQTQLRDEAVSYGIPAAEAERIVRTYSLDHAREMIWRSRQLRMQPTKSPLWASGSQKGSAA